MQRVSGAPSPYYGEPRKFDPNFKGPVLKRSYTDVGCCFVFIIVVLGYIALGTVAWINGDTKKLIYPTDSQGRYCGQPNTPNADKPILFYYDFLTCAVTKNPKRLQCPTIQRCVSTCPDQFQTYTEAMSNNDSSYHQYCRPDFIPGIKKDVDILKDQDCPTWVMPSRPFFQRCFPDFASKNGTLTVGNVTNFTVDGKTRNVKELRNAAKATVDMLRARAFSVKFLEDIGSSWVWILVCLMFALALSWLLLLLLRFTAGTIVWVIIIGVIVAVSYGIWYCYIEYTTLSTEPDADVVIRDIAMNTDLSFYLTLSQTWLVFMILLCIIDALILIVLIFLRSRLDIAIALLKQGNRAIRHLTCTLFFPVVTFLLLTIFTIFFLLIAASLQSSGEPQYQVLTSQSPCKHANKPCRPETFLLSEVIVECPRSRCIFSHHGGEGPFGAFLGLLHVCNTFAFLWLINFTLALGQCSLAGAFATYYWTLKKPRDLPTNPVCSAFNRTIRYHFGSVALGSLVITSFQIIRSVLEHIQQCVRGSNNCCARFVLMCLKSCFWCLEHSLKFINRNAYIMIAIFGKDYCTSSRDAFFLMMRNICRVTVLDKVTDFLLFLAKVLVAVGVGTLAFYFFSNKIELMKDCVPFLNYSWVPLLVVIFGAYVIASGFFNTYAMCVDTLFLCFLVDLEVNDGSEERPYYMGKNLRRIVQRKTPMPKTQGAN